jgi:hypothetical protein
MTHAYLRVSQVEKEITRSAKKILVEQGLNPSTKRGNKELSIVVRRLASTPCNNVQFARDLGTTLGQRIVTLSQKLGKTHLDQSIIQQLALEDDLPSLPEPTLTDVSVAPLGTVQVTSKAKDLETPRSEASSKQSVETPEEAVDEIATAAEQEQSETADSDVLVEGQAALEGEEDPAVEEETVAMDTPEAPETLADTEEEDSETLAEDEDLETLAETESEANSEAPKTLAAVVAEAGAEAELEEQSETVAEAESEEESEPLAVADAEEQEDSEMLVEEEEEPDTLAEEPEAELEDDFDEESDVEDLEETPVSEDEREAEPKTEVVEESEPAPADEVRQPEVVAEADVALKSEEQDEEDELEEDELEEDELEEDEIEENIDDVPQSGAELDTEEDDESSELIE